MEMSQQERRAALRAMDANLNRVAEALRVVEDICRFHWSLEGFAAELKRLRHEVLSAVCGGGPERKAMLSCRDIEGDVGRDIPSPPALGLNLEAIALRNLQRAKEALRTLQELGRIEPGGAAARLEKARYDLYALEKGLSHLPPHGDAQGQIARVQVYLLASSRLSRRPLVDAVADALDAGAGAVQLREKGLPDREILRTGRALREVSSRRGALLIVNDRPDLALRCCADGVHLGQDDLPVAEARAIIGEGRLIGVSTHSAAQARAAEREGADYIGAGPVFATATKDAGPALGPGGLAEILREVAVPSFAIGGIHEGNVQEVAAAGARRIAVSSAVLASEDPAAAVRALLKALGSPQNSART